MGLTDWSWGKVEPYFKKIENLTGPLDQSQIEARGRGGPMELCRPRYHFQWLE
jgi:choline dehydrogenase-like flavoprotein